MASRVRAVTQEQTSDPTLRELLIAGADGWWKDAEMFGVLGRIDAHLFELMRIKTGQINDCAY